MPSEITMPQLSDTMSEGTVVKWLKKEGDKVKAGEIIAEIETDKATMEMESFDAGTIALISVKEGGKVKVGERIAVLASGSETVDQVKKQFSGQSSGSAAPKASTEPKAAAVGQEAPREATATATIAPLAPVKQEGGAERIKISPLAKKIAADRGVNISQLRGSGPGGRIVQRDVESASTTDKKAQGSPSVGLNARVASGKKEVIQLTKLRATIAQRLQQSKQQIPHFYETIEIDVEELTEIRARVNRQLEKENIRLSLGDFLSKAIAVALGRHPQINAHLNGNEITRFGDVHLGMAVALPDGLIVPVLKNINQMGLKEIRQRSADLVDRARAQKLKGDELSGATFTVSNLGTYGIKEFSAIINPPEVAILAIAAAEKRPVFRNNAIVARTMLTVTLSADHRAIDGATAAEFLRTLKELLEEPGAMLM